MLLVIVETYSSVAPTLFKPPSFLSNQQSCIHL